VSYPCVSPGRLSAAIDVLTDVEQRRRPVSEALKAWGLNNRFAGAGDRAAIGNLVYDALRRRASHAFAMGSDSPRALVLAVALRDWAETRRACPKLLPAIITRRSR
jgi:16S rRNA (cytosine967-C5)-methyltransferase